MPTKPRVLFLCTGNACRSQMAEGWARALHGDRLQARSAGLEPAGVDPRAVRVMNEAGVDISSQRSTHVDDLGGDGFDFVVTVCARADSRCPVFPARVRRLYAPFDDPPRLASNADTDEEALAHYRRVRDEIRGFVEGLPERLLDGPQGGAG